MLSHKRQIRVGCSGWQYKHWRGDFYPTELPQSRWFGHYTHTFDTVEINNSFYRLPEATTFAKWREQAPRRFLYAVKASRFLTHMKKLKEPEQPLSRFFENVRELRSQTGPGALPASATVADRPRALRTLPLRASSHLSAHRGIPGAQLV